MDAKLTEFQTITMLLMLVMCINNGTPLLSDGPKDSKPWRHQPDILSALPVVLVQRFEVLAAMVKEAAEPFQVYAMQQSPADLDGSLKNDDIWKGDA